VRVILPNEDAERLAQLIEDKPVEQLRVEVREPVGEGGTVAVSLAGVEFAGKARRTPGTTGTFNVEDLDGRIIFVDE
jgi:hypothetical protein